MTREYFLYSEKPETGQAVETLVNFSGVPKGTVGEVCDWYEAGKTYTETGPVMTYGVMIRWHRWPGDSLKDGFSKSEYREFLKEI